MENKRGWSRCVHVMPWHALLFHSQITPHSSLITIISFEQRSCQLVKKLVRQRRGGGGKLLKKLWYARNVSFRALETLYGGHFYIILPRQERPNRGKPIPTPLKSSRGQRNARPCIANREGLVESYSIKGLTICTSGLVLNDPVCVCVLFKLISTHFILKKHILKKKLLNRN